jgi:hypothetical protein
VAHHLTLGKESVAMFQIVLSCAGVPEKEGVVGAADIVEEFGHRSWHRNVTCVWQNAQLILTAENDFDADGRALPDEFSDAICACLPNTFDIHIHIESVSEFDEKKRA